MEVNLKKEPVGELKEQVPLLTLHRKKEAPVVLPLEVLERVLQEQEKLPMEVNLKREPEEGLY